MKMLLKATGVSFIVALTVVATVMAQQVPFTIQAQVPSANTASFTVSRVTPGSPEVFTQIDTTNLDFGTLQFNSANGIFLPAFFWVIDIGSNGAGMPDVQFSYTDTANPNGALNDGTGLGGHGTIAYQEIVTNNDGSQTSNLIRGESLQQSNTSGGIDETDYDLGFLRVAVGLATGDTNLQEGNATPFTALDNPDIYSGTLTATATFD